MDVLEHFRGDLSPLSLQIRHLPTHHAVDGSRSRSHLGQHSYATCRVDWSCANGLKRQSEQRVAGENRGGLAESLVTRRLAASQVIVVQRRQVIVNQRIGVNEFERTS